MYIHIYMGIFCLESDREIGMVFEPSMPKTMLFGRSGCRSLGVSQQADPGYSQTPVQRAVSGVAIGAISGVTPG